MATSRSTPQDLYRLETLTDARLSPDGERVVYAVQRVDEETEKKPTNLWLVGVDGGEPAPFTTGDQADTVPRWSPQGDRVAFLSNRADEDQPQLHVIPADGGEARAVTDLHGEFGDFAWSPDGRRIAFAFRRQDEQERARQQDERRKKLGPAARHITRTFFRLDGRGYLPQERWHLWTVDIGSGRTRQLTSGTVHDETQPAWSHDGRHIVYVTNRADEPDHAPWADELCVISARGGAARALDLPEGNKQCPSVSPDGRWVACYATRGRRRWGQNTNLWVAPFDGPGRARNLTGRLDVTCLNVTMAGIMETTAPVWSAASDRLWFSVSRRGAAGVWSIARSGRRDSARDELPGDGCTAVAPFSLDREGRRLAGVRTTAHDPGQVHVAEVGNGQSRPVTGLNPWLQKMTLAPVQEVWCRRGQLQGWIMKPPGFRAERSYPSILQIHGGPHMQYSGAWMHEFQVLAAAGYVVYWCNPRGSQGYGEDHALAIDQDWGAPAHDDLMAFADLMARKRWIDTRRMGVTGGSYGGYMTCWIVGRTRRFAAAVTQRCVSNLVSMWGSSDFNWAFQQVCGDRPPWENLDEYWRQSPMKHVAQVRTPTLVMHSENDLRCSKEQGEQFYVALRRLGVDTELVLFPEESHGLSRGGRTDRRVARLEHMLRWFDRWLKR